MNLETNHQLSEIQDALNAAAQAIAMQPTRSWVGWVTYLLESLEEAISKQDHQQILDCHHAQKWLSINVAHEIKARLESGGW